MTLPPHLIVLLGGARSGKSRYAEQWAREHGRQVLFVATAQALDPDMAARIARHQADRPAGWRTLEAPLNVAAAVRREIGAADVAILDCLTMLASNVMMTLPEDRWEDAHADEVTAALLIEVDALLAACQESAATWLVISNEVGMGIVPPYPSGRAFRDALGRANQRVASAADRVLLLVAGLPWELKSAGTY